jgi:hypothetical protein
MLHNRRLFVTWTITEETFEPAAELREPMIRICSDEYQSRGGRMECDVDWLSLREEIENSSKKMSKVDIDPK